MNDHILNMLKADLTVLDKLEIKPNFADLARKYIQELYSFQKTSDLKQDCAEHALQRQKVQMKRETRYSILYVPMIMNLIHMKNFQIS